MRNIAIVLLGVTLVATPAAADDHSDFLTWQHKQDQKYEQQENDYSNGKCGIVCKGLLAAAAAYLTRQIWLQQQREAN